MFFLSITQPSSQCLEAYLFLLSGGCKSAGDGPSPFSFSFSPNSQPSSQCLQAHHFSLSGGCKSAGGAPLAFFFLFLFFPQLPTLFPPGKGPFASLARLLSSTTAFATFDLLSGRCKSAGARPVPFSYSSFYFVLIDISLFKDRGVAMGKPHCNSSI